MIGVQRMNERDEYIKEIKTELAVMVGKLRKVNKGILTHGMSRLELFALQQIHENRNEGEEKKGIRVSTLAKKMDILLSSASRTLNSLEEQGLIYKEIDPASRRNVCLFLTEKGERVREKSLENMNVLIEKVIDQMGEEDMSQLAKLWKQFADLVEKEVNDMTEKNNQGTK